MKTREQKRTRAERAARRQAQRTRARRRIDNLTRVVAQVAVLSIGAKGLGLCLRAIAGKMREKVRAVAWSEDDAAEQEREIEGSLQGILAALDEAEASERARLLMAAAPRW